jgi:hypothetical protein
MMSFAFIQLIETICSRELQDSSDFFKFKEKKQMFESINEQQQQQLTIISSENSKKLLVEQMTNLAELIVELIMLDQHYIDNQWPTVLNENDDNIEAEIDAIKLYVERFILVN